MLLGWRLRTRNRSKSLDVLVKNAERLSVRRHSENARARDRFSL